MEFFSKLYRPVRGFTLVELLIVVGLLGLIASIAVFLLDPQAQINKANDGLRKSDLVKIQSALEIYRANNGDYPGSIGWCSQIASSAYPQIKQALEPDYMSEVPRDPKFEGTQRDYFYWHSSYGRYYLYAVLEHDADPAITPGILRSDGLMSCAGASNSYNYRVGNL